MGRPVVPLLDLKAQYVQLEDEISDALREVCASQYFILGPGVKKLEEAIAEYCQCDHGRLADRVVVGAVDVFCRSGPWFCARENRQHRSANDYPWAAASAGRCTWPVLMEEIP